MNTSAQPLIHLDGVTKVFFTDKVETHALAGIHLEIKSGEYIAIAGPSGCGKSTLFRAIAGIWPYGSGDIAIPAGATMLFLPQRSYLPIGSLRAASRRGRNLRPGRT